MNIWEKVWKKKETDSSTNLIWVFRSWNSFMVAFLVPLLFRGILTHVYESVSAPIFQSRWNLIQLTKACMFLCSQCVEAQSEPCSWLREGCQCQPNWGSWCAQCCRTPLQRLFALKERRALRRWEMTKMIKEQNLTIFLNCSKEQIQCSFFFGWLYLLCIL